MSSENMCHQRFCTSSDRSRCRRQAKVGQISISDSSVWRQAEVWGQGVQAIVEAERIRSHLLPGRWGGPEVFGEIVWAEAARRDWPQAADTEVIGDGAPWIWNLALDHFYDSRQVVDWYHAAEHLAQAARLVKDEGSLAEKVWYNARETT